MAILQRMFLAIIPLISLIFAASAIAQEEPTVPYQIPAPAGWSKESIPLPPSFAPDMKWHGVEELRFAPNWRKEDSATFFSYSLMFWLPDSQKTDTKTLQSELLTYYRGLAKAVSEDKKQVIDTKPFTMSIKADSTKVIKSASGEGVTAYLGELKWIEPFTTGKSQTLRMDIHVWRDAKHNGSCVFICASPQPQAALVWKSLREIRDGTIPLPGTASGQKD